MDINQLSEIVKKKIHEFRRSWDTPPDPLNKNNIISYKYR